MKPLNLREQLQKAQKTLGKTPSADGNFQHLSGMLGKSADCGYLSTQKEKADPTLVLIETDAL